MSFEKAVYHKNRRSDTSLFRFEENGKAGYINSTGKIVIPPQFDVGWFSEEDFVEGLSPARRGENWGYIDPSGKWIIPAQYWRVQPFSEGLAAVTLPLKEYDFPAAYIDKGGRVVVEFPKGLATAGPFSEGMAAVRLNGYSRVGKLGYVDRSGAVVIPYQFATGGPFKEGLAAVVFDGQCYIEARDGSNRGTPPSVPAATSCGGVPPFITKRCGEGFIDRSGKTVFRFESTTDFSEGVAAIERSGKWGYIDPKGHDVIRSRFDAARPFSEGVAAVKLAGKWGYVDRSDRWVILPRFDRADDFSDGLALTSEGYIDKNGTGVASPKGGSAFVLGLAHVILGEQEFGYIDHSGHVIFRYETKPVPRSMLPYSNR
jgi:hypothetical protein